MELCTIASGSSGNCTYIATDKTKVLVDIGISGKKTIAGLQNLGVNPQHIEAILITHEHGDHIKGVGIFSRKFDTPIYATEKTWDIIDEKQLLGKVEPHNKKILVAEQILLIGNLKIKPYPISHDAVEPVGFLFYFNNKKIALFTDTGVVDQKLLEEIKDCDGVLMEFNYDKSMLEVGSYPYNLKRRILSDFGHLCNDTAAKVLVNIYHSNLRWVILGHLSKENNVPDLAYITAKNALEENNIQIDKDIQIHVAHRENNSPLFTV